ncbi:hypothetical protein [Thalassotalea sp. SU-HH00458]|uniref:hypothetical protein n=1 Tax=Thalassotalea sp. SU-HH00458 TaxID=3127657 RepID=UPI00310C20FA
MSKLFDPRKSFFELSIVRATALIIIGLSFILLGGGLWGEGYSFALNGIAYNTFINDFKLPISILALLIPFGALYAAQHRSEISIVQIEATESQNNFANYYKHLEEFKEVLKEHQYTEKFNNHRKLHITLFPEAKHGKYIIPSAIRSLIITKLLICYKSLRKIEEVSIALANGSELEAQKQKIILDLLIQAYTPIKELRKTFQFVTNDQDTITPHGISESKDKINFYNYISEIQQTALYLKEITIFCGEFEIPAIMNAFSLLETEGGLLHGIPTSNEIVFNLPKLTEDGERAIMTTTMNVSYSIEN